MASPSESSQRKEGIRCKECDKLVLGKDDLAVLCPKGHKHQILALLSEAIEQGYLNQEEIGKFFEKQKKPQEEKEMTQGWTTLESRSRQFNCLMEQLISAEMNPQIKAGLEKSKKNISIEEIERIFSPVNIIIEQQDVSQNYYHSVSGVEHLLKIIFKAPDDKGEKQEPTFRVIEISLESNDLHYRKDGVSGHDWKSLTQISKWKAIKYGDGLLKTMHFVCDIGGEKHLLTINDEGEYELHSQTAYYGS